MNIHPAPTPCRIFLPLVLVLCMSYTGWVQAQEPAVCDRTPQVRDWIVEQIQGVTDCADVSAEQLLAIEGSLTLRATGITTLQVGDFQGLSLINLNISHNHLTMLPAGVFADLRLSGDMSLFFNQIETLPAGVFAGLRVGDDLNLALNQLTTLPAGVFADLRVGGDLNLSSNRMEMLSAGMFTDLSLGGNLLLSDNPNAPFALTVELARVDAAPGAVGPATMVLRVAEGTPVALAIPVTASATGSLSASETTLAAGATMSNRFTVTGADLTTVALGILPTLPAGYKGLRLIGSAPLALFGSADNTGPMLVETAITSAPTNGTAYATGELIEITLSFDETLVVDTSTGRPGLLLQIGDDTREALHILAGRGMSTLVFRYRVETMDRDDDGISWAMNALHLNGASVEDRSGNAASFVVPAQVTAASHQVNGMGVCARTPQVRDWIVGHILGVDCADVTAEQLSRIRTVFVLSRFAALRAGDFQGLTLSTLILSNSQLTTLPVGVFSGLHVGFLDLSGNNLTTLPVGVFADLHVDVLDLSGNGMTTLPAGVFSGLSVQTLLLSYNRLTMLPAGVFSGLSVSQALNLSVNRLQTLPAGVFAGLNMRSLLLSNNQLRTLPAGVFSGLSFETVDLSTNPGTPFYLRVELERVDTAPSTARSAEVRLRLVEGIPQAIVVPLMVSGGAGRLGSDTASFTVGATSSDIFTVTATDTTTVSLGTLPALADYQGMQLSRGEALVLFDTTASMSAPGYAVTEGEVARISVAISPIAFSALTLSYIITTDTDDTTRNAEARDYTDANSGSLLVPADKLRASAVIEINVADDNLAELAEVFVVTLSGVTAADGSTVRLDRDISSIVTIAANDTPELTLAGPAEIVEGQTASYTINLSTEPVADVMLFYAVTGTAAPTTHYAAPVSGTATVDTTAGTVTIPSGVSSADFSIATIHGAMGTNIVVTVSDPVGGGGETPVLGTAMLSTSIRDATDLSIPTALSVNEADSVDLTVTAAAAVQADTTVEYTVTAGTAEAADYSATGNSITISADQTEAVIELMITDDNLVENAEIFTITLDRVQSSADDVELGAATTTITITEDTADVIVVSLTGFSAVREGREAVYTVNVTGGVSTAAVVVNYTVAGTAGSGEDYTAPSGSLSIAEGEASGTIEIVTTDDGIGDSGETLIVTLSRATGGGGPAAALTVHSATNSVTTSLVEQITISMGEAMLTVAEGASVVLPVLATETAPVGGITIGYMISSDSNTPGQAASTDYMDDTGGSITILAGDTVANIELTVNDDNSSEQAEEFTVNLSEVTAGDAILAGELRTTVTIPENDPIMVMLSGPGEVAEGEVAAYTVALSGGAIEEREPLRVKYATPADAASPATAGEDYTGAAGTFTFTSADFAGKTISIQTMEDMLYDPDEHFTVMLSELAGGGGRSMLVTDRVSTMIADDDFNVEITGMLGGDVQEGALAGFQVILRGLLVQPLTVPWSILPATADDDDYGTTEGALIFGVQVAYQTQILSVSTDDDNLSEPAETFMVRLGTASGLSAGGHVNDVTMYPVVGTITASDPITATLSGPPGVVEGERADYTVALSGGQPTADIEVLLHTSGGQFDSAEAAVDYIPIMHTLVFTPADYTRPRMASLMTLQDNLVESDEALSVYMQPSGGGGAELLSQPGSIVLAITDNDVRPTFVALSTEHTGALLEGSEPVSIRITVTLGDASVRLTDDVLVALRTAGTATRGIDYTLSGIEFISILAGSTTASTTLLITPYADVATEEEFVEIGGTWNAGIAQAVLRFEVQDRRPYVLILSNDDVVFESAEEVSISVALRGVPSLSGNLLVPYRTVAIDAEAEQDYISVSGTLEFPVGFLAASGSSAAVTRQSLLPISILQDRAVEAPETFRVQFGRPAGNEERDVISFSDDRDSVVITLLDALDLNRDLAVDIVDARIWLYVAQGESLGRLEVLRRLFPMLSDAVLQEILQGRDELGRDFNGIEGTDLMDAAILYNILALPGSMGISTLRLALLADFWPGLEGSRLQSSIDQAICDAWTLARPGQSCPAS